VVAERDHEGEWDVFGDIHEGALGGGDGQALMLSDIPWVKITPYPAASVAAESG